MSKSRVRQAWLHVYLNKNSIMFCLFTLWRSRTETASSNGCLASDFVFQHVSLCDSAKHVCSHACYKRRNNLAASPCGELHLYTKSSVFFTLLLCTLSLIHSGGADWLSAVWVQRDTVFISLAVRVRLWSVSCCLRVDVQHLITSLGICLKGYTGPVCDRNGCEADQRFWLLSKPTFKPLQRQTLNLQIKCWFKGI